MPSNRRMGAIESGMAQSMMQAAEAILKEEGYAALTSRRIADYPGVKQRLLYYYSQAGLKVTCRSARLRKL